MRIRSVRHRGLKRLLEQDSDREIRRDMTKRVRNVLAALMSAESVRSLKGLPGWRVHELSGDRKGTVNLDLEDYH